MKNNEHIVPQIRKILQTFLWVDGKFASPAMQTTVIFSRLSLVPIKKLWEGLFSTQMK